MLSVLYAWPDMQPAVPRYMSCTLRGCLWYFRRDHFEDNEWEVAQGTFSPYVCPFVCATPAALDTGRYPWSKRVISRGVSLEIALLVILNYPASHIYRLFVRLFSL
jgi:hypothetical protein